ncbi:MAG: LptA/OstA family protein [Thermoanaerobaculia bacterium]
MQRTVRFLRIALPVAFVGFLLLLVFSYSPRRSVERSGGEPVRSDVRPGDKPRLVASTFEDTQTIGGRVVSRIRARRTTGFESGWYALEDVHLTLYREGGLTYEVSCEQAQFQAETKEAEAKGNVRITSSDGLEVSTESIRYDGTRVVNRIPVRFSIDQWHGRAGGLDLDVAGDTVHLVDGITATSTPAVPSEPPLELTAQLAIFHRASSQVEFHQDVVLTRATDRLRSDAMTARLDQNHHQIVALAGDGNVAIRLMPGNTLSANPSPPANTRIDAEKYFVEFGGDGSVAAFDVVGEQIPAHALFQGVPQREVFARQFRLGVANGRATDVKATGKVRFQELGSIPRVITADEMTVFLDKNTGQPLTSVIAGNLHYRDPKTEATGERANYDIPGDHVVLTAVAGSEPTVTSDGQLLKAVKLEIAPKRGVVKGSGQVLATLKQKGQSSIAPSGGIFDPNGQPVFVNSDSILMNQSERSAVFTGNVRAWQGRNTLFAEELRLTGGGDELQARGNVRTVLYNAGTGEPSAAPVTTRSNTMVARKADQKIDLQGQVTIDDGLRRMTADRASFFLGADRKLQRIEANANLTMVERATNRKAAGDRAVYRLDQKKVMLYGSPAEITDPEGTVKGAEIILDLVSNKVEVASGEKPTEATYKPKSGEKS